MKLLVFEEGSDVAQAVRREARETVTSRLTYAEARAALAAARRSGRTTRSQHDEAKRRLRELLSEARLVEATPQIVDSAGDLAEEHGLRGYDAIHLASVLALPRNELLMMTWDEDLRRASRRSGLDLAP